MSSARIRVPLEAASLPAPRPRVLVVGSEPSATRWVAGRLSGTHDVVVESRGETALGRVRCDPGFDLILCDLAAPGAPGLGARQLLERLAPGLVHQFIFVTRDEATGKAHVLLGRAPGRPVDEPFDAEAVRRLLQEGVVGRHARRGRAAAVDPARALEARDLIAHEAARRVPEGEARELANTVAQHLLLGLDARSAIAEVVRHRIREGWLGIAETEEVAFCRDLADALERHRG